MLAVHTYIYICTYIWTATLNKLKCLFTYKASKIVVEWLLQQNHRVGGMIEAQNERIETVHQGCR